MTHFERATLDRVNSSLERREMLTRAARLACSMAGGGGGGAPDPVLLNIAQRQAVLGRSVEMTQQIYSNTFAALAAGANTININPSVTWASSKNSSSKSVAPTLPLVPVRSRPSG
jgi:hypothetical protein